MSKLRHGGRVFDDVSPVKMMWIQLYIRNGQKYWTEPEETAAKARQSIVSVQYVGNPFQVQMVKSGDAWDFA